MKKTLQNAAIILGLLLLIGGLSLYALASHGYIEIAAGKLPIPAAIFGAALTVGGACELLIKRSKSARTEANDERNIIIAKTAKSFAFSLMSVLLAAAAVILVLTDLITLTAFFILAAIYLICQLALICKLWSLQKRM